MTTSLIEIFNTFNFLKKEALSPQGSGSTFNIGTRASNPITVTLEANKAPLLTYLGNYNDYATFSDVEVFLSDRSKSFISSDWTEYSRQSAGLDANKDLDLNGTDCYFLDIATNS